MSDDVAELREALAALRGELNETKARLAKLEQVVVFDEVEGRERAYVECSHVAVREFMGAPQIAVHLGADEEGGFVWVNHRCQEVAHQPAIQLCLHGDVPHLCLRGKDGKPRADLFIGGDDCGAAAVFSAGGAPGAIMKGRPGGGSVAVLQPDGRARAVLVHEEKKAGKEEAGPATELIFALPTGKTVMKLHADEGGGMIAAGPPGQPDMASLIGREEGGSVLLRSPEKKTSIALLATDGMASLNVMDGLHTDAGALASLRVHEGSARLVLQSPDGSKAVQVAARDQVNEIAFLDAEGDAAVRLGHLPEDGRSFFQLRGAEKVEGIRMLATKDHTSVELAAPDEPETKVVCSVQEGRPVVGLLREKRPLVQMMESEQSGMVVAYGPTAEKAGIASLAGGAVTGSLVLAQPDGTSQLTLDGTDHGGRLVIHNDLGFHRIVMGVHQDSAALHLNHTGLRGVDLVATEKGGVVCVCDAEGRVIGTLPEGSAEP